MPADSTVTIDVAARPNGAYSQFELTKIASYSVPRAAEYLGLSISCLNKWRVYGLGPRFCKLGSRVFYQKSDLDEWRKQHICTSTSEYATRRLIRLK